MARAFSCVCNKVATAPDIRAKKIAAVLTGYSNTSDGPIAALAYCRRA